MAITTFVGQNLGAKQYDRAKKGAKFGILCSISIAELIGITIYTAAPVLIAAFNRDPDVIHYGIDALRTVYRSKKDDRFLSAAERFHQRFGNHPQIPDRQAEHCVGVLVKIGNRPVFPVARMNRFHQPVGFFGRFGDVHAEVEVFRSCPGRQYRSKLLLDLVFRNFTADECSDAVSAFEIIFIHQSADRLTERHVTDAEFVRHNPKRGR